MWDNEACNILHLHICTNLQLLFVEFFKFVGVMVPTYIFEAAMLQANQLMAYIERMHAWWKEFKPLGFKIEVEKNYLKHQRQEPCDETQQDWEKVFCKEVDLPW